MSGNILSLQKNLAAELFFSCPPQHLSVMLNKVTLIRNGSIQVKLYVWSASRSCRFIPEERASLGYVSVSGRLGLHQSSETAAPEENQDPVSQP